MKLRVLPVPLYTTVFDPYGGARVITNPYEFSETKAKLIGMTLDFRQISADTFEYNGYYFNRTWLAFPSIIEDFLEQS